MGRNGSSTTPAGNGRQSVIKYQATYRLESQNPYNREKCDKILKLVVDKAMKTFEYTPENAVELCENMSNDIKSRIKLLEFDRYKIICTVTIGERHMQSYNSRLNFLWDAEKDGFTYYIHDNPIFYVIATIFAVYCE